MSENYTTATAVAQLRTLANAIEALPAGIPTPTHIGWGPYVHTPEVQWLLFGDGSDAQQKAEAVEIVRAIGGYWAKRGVENLFKFTRVADGVQFEVTVSRPAVCELVVTGVETVTEEVPDPDALAQVPTITVTREVEQTEWHCQPLLAEAVPA